MHTDFFTARGIQEAMTHSRISFSSGCGGSQQPCVLKLERRFHQRLCFCLLVYVLSAVSTVSWAVIATAVNGFCLFAVHVLTAYAVKKMSCLFSYCLASVFLV
eukprot:m.240210 g.240210  ORF g.240210 m.240210 type:complete len:103 (+) comp15302_c2_seq1:3937-4245(+)